MPPLLPNSTRARNIPQHISVGRCRMLAINYGVALPPYEVLSQHGFMETRVPAEEWIVPDDCKRFLKKLAEEGLCYGRCATCEKLVAKQSPLEPRSEASLRAQTSGATRVSQRPRGEGNGLVTRREAALRARPPPTENDMVTGGWERRAVARRDAGLIAYNPRRGRRRGGGGGGGGRSRGGGRRTARDGGHLSLRTRGVRARRAVV